MKVLLCYRAGDALGWPQVLTSELGKRLGQRNIVDGAALDPATAREQIVEQASGCAALLAIIGPAWLADSAAPDGPANVDRIRLQLATAFQHGVRVLAVRVGGAEMPEDQDLPEDIRRLSKLQTPELTAANQRAIIREICLGIDPDRPKRRLRRMLDISLSALAAGLATFIAVKAWISSRPQLNDELWLHLLANIELGAPTTRYFDRAFESMPVSTAGPAHWDAKELVTYLEPWAKEFSCASERDTATFWFLENRLQRVSFRFCDRPDPCQSRRFAVFAALAGVAPAVGGQEGHFEARGKKVDVLGWSGPGLTAVDIVEHGQPRLDGEPWFSFLRTTVVKNQCKL
jgi:hypothetical protein